MASAPSRPSSKRYDCFISFHGDEPLADLGFSGLSGRGMEGTVSDLAEEVGKRLRDLPGRHPSVFNRHSGIGGRISEELAQALRELRGGGIGLVLLSPKYLGTDYCLAELRALLELENLRNDGQRRDEAIEIRVVYLQKISQVEVVRSALNDPSLGQFFNGLNPGDFNLHPVVHVGTRYDVVKGICNHVQGYWRQHQSLCLGEDQLTCLAYLQQLNLPALSLIASKLEVNLQSTSTLDTIFSQAFQQNKLTDYNLNALLGVTSDIEANDALRSFRRKWTADGCRWGTKSGENDFCFKSLTQEAATALQAKHGAASSTGIDPSITPLPPQSSASQPTYSHRHASFRPYFPDRQRLSSGLEANAATSLAQLKAAIFSTSFGDGSPGACNSGNHESSARLRHVALTSVAGEGGVGKTGTCKLLCADEDVRKHFAGGALLWIDVGRGATEEKVKSEIRGAMRKCGGKEELKEIRINTSVDEAVDIAREFSERRVLVVIDNVWETPANSSWAALLSEIASSPRSVVIMTTRSSSLSEGSGFDPIRLGRLDLAHDNSPDWYIAEQLYDALLKETPEKQSSDDYKESRRKGLELSCGSLLGIRTFAGLVRNRMRICGNVQSLLESIEKKVLGLAGRGVGEELTAVIGHHGLFAAMKESLAHLDEHKGRYVKLAPLAELKDGEGKDVRQFRASYDRHVGKPLSSRYAALEVMLESSTRLSFPILCRLWHVATVAEAGEIALLFVDIGLGCIEGGRAGQEKEFVLHDLQYEFCVSISEGNAGSARGDRGGIPRRVNGHAIFLSSCESRVGSVVAADGPGSEWASFCFHEGPGLPDSDLRRYLAQNLFRHLFAAAAEDICGAVQTMLSVLSQFQWTWGRICADGRTAILMDCSHAKELLESKKSNAELRTSEISSGGLQFICWFREWLMVAAAGVATAQSDGTLAGSLLQLAQSVAGRRGACSKDVAIAKKLAASVERHVRGPWLKPIKGCCHVYSSDRCVIAEDVVGGNSGVGSVAALGDGKHILSGAQDGVVRVHECLFLSTQLSFRGHLHCVTCLSVAAKEGDEVNKAFPGSRDRMFTVFSGSVDKSVRFWKACVGFTGVVSDMGSDIVGKVESEVTCLAVSKSGARVSAGCLDRNIFIWELTSGGTSISYEPLIVLESSSLSIINTVALSRSGVLVVAGDRLGTVASWKEKGHAADEVWEEMLASGESGLCDESENSESYDADENVDADAIWVAGKSGIPDEIEHADEGDDRDESYDSFRDLPSVFLSRDEKAFLVFHANPAYVEIWDVEPRIRRFRTAIPEFKALTGAALSGDGFPNSGRSGLFVQFVAIGWGQIEDYILIEYSLGTTLRVLASQRIISLPLCICPVNTGVNEMFVVGVHNGCVRLMQPRRSAASDGAEVQKENELLAEGKTLPAVEASLGEVDCVAVLPVSGCVVATHGNGYLSLWQAEDGMFRKCFMDKRWYFVDCIDVSDDESVAVSGHSNGAVLVWDVATWNCLFPLEGHAEPVHCATISVDRSRIVTVDKEGEVRVWDAENGAVLMTFGTWSTRSHVRWGAISREESFFLWASKQSCTGMWKVQLVDLALKIGIDLSEEEFPDREAVLETVRKRAGVANGKEVSWRVGAVGNSRLKQLPAVSRRLQDSWQVSVEVVGDGLWQLVCSFQSADRTIHPQVNMKFDTKPRAIAAGWMKSRVGEPRRAVIACRVHGRSAPAIVHFVLRENRAR